MARKEYEPTHVADRTFVERIPSGRGEHVTELRLADDQQQAAPVMSRSTYRDALRELWELDVHMMQVFNPMHDNYEELALTELQDAVLAYDEMLKQRNR